VRVVDPVEAFLDDERISSSSPLAVALLGHAVGDQCPVHAPSGVWTATVLGIGEDV
jgi:transcription elongation GreA/GreB family factor